MVNTKKENIRQEAGVRNAMGYGEVRVQFEQRLGARQAGIIWGGKHFRQLKRKGKSPERNRGIMFKDHQGGHCVYWAKWTTGKRIRGKGIVVRVGDSSHKSMQGFWPKLRGKEMNTGGFWAEERWSALFFKSSWLQWWGVRQEWKQDQLGSYNNLGERWQIVA